VCSFGSRGALRAPSVGTSTNGTGPDRHGLPRSFRARAAGPGWRIPGPRWLSYVN